jgi:hypothetical protein
MSECAGWSNTPHSDHFGIITATDAGQEWLVPWFVENVRRYNDIPISVVDLGMTEQGVGVCKDLGLVVHHAEIPDFTVIWYTKPWAILQAEYNIILWLDLDCEVLGDITPMADLLESHQAIAIQRDFGAGAAMCVGQYPGEPKINAGTLVVRRHADVICKWARAVEYMAGYARSDQEAFTRVLYLEDTIERAWIPEPYTALRCVGPMKPSDLIYHWTGPVGKEHIRKEINHPQEEDLWGDMEIKR